MSSRLPFKNDGSFMEIFKQLQAEQERAALGASLNINSSKSSKNESSITNAPFNLDVILPKISPPEDHKNTIAIESLVMRVAGLPQSLADSEIAKFEDSVQYWFLTVTDSTEYKYFQKRLQEEIIKKKKTVEVVDASKVEYKLSDIQLPPDHPPKLTSAEKEVKTENEIKAELKGEREQKSLPPSRKRKSRWDADHPVKIEPTEEKPLSEIEASVKEAARIAAQLAASGAAAPKSFPSSAARQFAGGVALSDEQIKQIQYQKEVSSCVLLKLFRKNPHPHLPCASIHPPLLEHSFKPCMSSYWLSRSSRHRSRS
ncbi:unnamed protein product [Hymenolepis diminuta]|uniref:SURP motif domain-containing protein n=1 Tax=Hymenolepis diminuta TaxID=6216 RepID=A0A564YKA5_HYMDI|nr:unnamed protein product [Hymenolepis diminuta]